MRHIGIDYGSKRVGVAISDEGNAVAFPKEVMENDSNLLPRIAELCRREGVTEAVLGESTDFSGNYNPIMEQALAFKAALEHAGIAVALEPEFLTSVQAARESDNDMLDASAAALILQSYLDRINNSRKSNDHDR